MAMPMMRCACRPACSRASSSMRLTMWAASIRASSSITRTSSSRACWAVRPAICSSLPRSSSNNRASSASCFSACFSRAVSERSSWFSSLSRRATSSPFLSRESCFWVSRRSWASSSARCLREIFSNSLRAWRSFSRAATSASRIWASPCRWASSTTLAASSFACSRMRNPSWRMERHPKTKTRTATAAKKIDAARRIISVVTGYPLSEQEGGRVGSGRSSRSEK